MRGSGDAKRLLLRWDALEPLRARARREVLLAMKARAERGDADARATKFGTK